MFAKKKKAKKSINALVLAAACAGSIGFPSLIHTLSTLRMAPTCNTNNTSPQKDFATAKARAQSLGAAQFQHASSSATLFDETPTPRPLKPCSSNESLSPSVRAPKSRPTQHIQLEQPVRLQTHSEAVDEDWDLEFSKQSICADTLNHQNNVNQINLRAPALPPFPRKPKPHPRALMAPQQRRVVSAPSFAGHLQFGESDDIPATAAGGVVDALWDTVAVEDEFLVASVKQKVVARREKELERSVSADGGLESWDDDFCCFGGEDEDVPAAGNALVVPEFLGSVQEALRVDSENIRKFALHIEGALVSFDGRSISLILAISPDLKLLYLDAQDISTGLEFDTPELVEPVKQKYHSHLETAEVLIHLGDFNDDVGDEKLLTDELHVRVLGQLLGDSVGVGKLAVARIKMEFSGVFMPVLIKCIGPVKVALNEYVNELRKISREAV
ncbi:hypothetical protein CcCBS67573_g05769 [Chytriomyces confervae]|uniref:Uncharacterized protein n=1 Tax=Chytriomyces confervae TaxID=246404 RepID=A0A507FBA8_9FUNG|nr:hypothetical protein CcCBS67573_g05769 [Chytriomyces confervae]